MAVYASRGARARKPTNKESTSERRARMQARARFMSKARQLGHETEDAAYMRQFVNYLLGRSRSDRTPPSEADYNRATKDLGFWAITADGFKEFICGNTTPRKEWLAGFEKRWSETHPGEPVPDNALTWMKYCTSGKLDEIETKGSGG